MTGPTLAMVGDNPSGKELMIPWERIGDLGGGGSVEVTGILTGENINIANKRYQEKLARTGRS